MVVTSHFLYCECNNTEMVSVTLSPDDEVLRRIRRIQALTIIWMTVEAAVSLAAAWVAHSPALLAFGGDSAIELLSAAMRKRATVRSWCTVRHATTMRTFVSGVFRVIPQVLRARVGTPTHRSPARCCLRPSSKES